MPTHHTIPAEEAALQTESIRRVAAFHAGKHPLAYLQTFGCQQNEADSEKFAGLLQSMGYTVTDTPEGADVIVINTCAVREHAEKRALSFIGQYKHLKEQNPKMILAVTGCMVAQEHRAETVKRSYPYVDFTFNPSSMHRFPELLCKRLLDGAKRTFCLEEPEYTVWEGVPIARKDRFRAWVSVMYGCNNFCSYCIVPYTRGRERSRAKEDVIREVRQLVADGYREITLLGQNVNSYGKTDGFPYDFADLLEELDRVEGDYLIRFMTSHPKDASLRMIEVMANSKHIAHQFHLPLQSGSDFVLKRMNRHYDLEKYFSSLDAIRRLMPDAAVSTDIIVGFPGETDGDFNDTLRALKRAQFDMIYSFLYSPRKGTPASEYPDQVPDEVKAQRFARMLALQEQISLSKNVSLVGKDLRILSDGTSKNSEDMQSGRTEGNKIVFYKGSPEDNGKHLTVHIDRADAFALWGTIKV